MVGKITLSRTYASEDPTHTEAPALTSLKRSRHGASTFKTKKWIAQSEKPDSLGSTGRFNEK
ncbi:MAG: hypothetical protein LBV77_00465 [Candidatus Adiutrix intracellularis]|jgi:hypothetical protein|nr:hypothetical protein [Candidatus Adiutrix intracellularis]